MRDIYFLIAYAVGGVLIIKGIWQLIRSKLLILRCKGETTGIILDSAQRRSLLFWPSMDSYYPIFQFDDEKGDSQVFASANAAAFENQIVPGRSYTIRYDPEKPSRFFSPEWDGPSKITAVSQLSFGLLILGATVFAAIYG